MLAKIFGKADKVDPSQLANLVSLEPAQQVALLDRCLALTKQPDFPLQANLDQAIAELLTLLGSQTAALSDAELTVAARASTLCQDPQALAALLDHQHLAPLAAKRLSKLLPLDAAHPANGHAKVFQARLENASSADIDALAQHASQPEEMAMLVIRATADARTALLASPLLRGEAGLAILEKISRGRDKNCNRLAREGLERIRDSRRILSSHKEALSEVIDSTQRELKITPSDLDALIVQRKKLGMLHQRYETLLTDIKAAEQSLSDAGEDTEAFSAATNPFSGLNLDVPSPQDNPYPTLLARLKAVGDTLGTADWLELQALAQYQQTLEHIRDGWHEAQNTFLPGTAQQQTFDQTVVQVHQHLDAWQRLCALPWQDLAYPGQTDDGKTSAHAVDSRTIDQWLSKAQQAMGSLNWPGALATPSKLEQLQQQINAAAEQKAATADQQRELTKELKTLSGTLQGLIDQGEFKRALSALGRCRNLQKQGAKGAEKLLNRASQQLEELSDWQQFAASPKRDTLLQGLRDLVDNPKEPEAQRQQLKDLRAQWNGLGPLPKEQRQLQQSFDDLAEQAFAVCKAHFNEQNKQRRQNLQARKALCAQLQEYLDNTDWSNADMKAAETIMRQARNQWREHHPCDRKALKPVEVRFEALQETLFGHLKDAWDANISAKEALISQAQTLLDQESSDGLANQAKALQAQWREVGSTPRGADQRLWKKFRQICDGIFQRLGQERDSERSAQQALADALVADIQAFDPDQADLSAANAALNDLADRARDLRLESQHRKTLSNLQRALSARQANKQRQAQSQRLEEFQAWDEQVSQAEISGETLASPHALFNARIAGTADTEDLLALTMEAEMAADISGPADEQNTRMTLQIDLMNRGIRNLQLVTNQQLLERWCRSGPKSADHQALRQRFFKALAARLD
jgi:exonuclease SbcC